jgi:hypothetical protein
MADLTAIREHMEVIGADGVHVGVVDRLENNRIKLARSDSEDYRHHFIDAGLVAEVEGNKLRLSANAAVAVTLEEDS